MSRGFVRARLREGGMQEADGRCVESENAADRTDLQRNVCGQGRVPETVGEGGMAAEKTTQKPSRMCFVCIRRCCKIVRTGVVRAATKGEGSSWPTQGSGEDAQIATWESGERLEGGGRWRRQAGRPKASREDGIGQSARVKAFSVFGAASDGSSASKGQTRSSSSSSSSSSSRRAGLPSLDEDEMGLLCASVAPRARKGNVGPATIDGVGGGGRTRGRRGNGRGGPNNGLGRS